MKLPVQNEPRAGRSGCCEAPGGVASWNDSGSKHASDRAGPHGAIATVRSVTLIVMLIALVFMFALAAAYGAAWPLVLLTILGPAALTALVMRERRRGQSSAGQQPRDRGSNQSDAQDIPHER